LVLRIFSGRLNVLGRAVVRVAGLGERDFDHA